MNSIKTTLLLVAMTGLLMFFGQLLGGNQGVMMAFILSLLMNFGAYWFSDKIVLKAYKAKQVDESSHPEFVRLVASLAQNAGLPMPRVYIIPTMSPNAFATGRNPQNAAVAATEGLMRMLSRDELEGVMAHELAHVKNRDTLVSTLSAAIAGAISYLAYMAQWAMILGGGRDSRENNNPIGMIALLVSIIVMPIAAMIIQMMISRGREFMADEGGAQISGKPLALASALRKLEQGAAAYPIEASPATSHMFIVNPLSGRAAGIANLFSTHPQTADRVARLERMAARGVGITTVGLIR